jgi:hypothetical protein
MPVEICSPISRKGSKVDSGQPMSPGARSNPSRASSDSVPAQPSQTASPICAHSEDFKPTMTSTGRTED